MNKFTLFIVVLFALSFFASCGPKSEKGKWIEADKATFKTSFIAEVKKGQPALADDVIGKIADCAVMKLEAEFSVADVAKKENEAKVAELVTACTTENMPAPVMETPADTTSTAATDTTKAPAK